MRTFKPGFRPIRRPRFAFAPLAVASTGRTPAVSTSSRMELAAGQITPSGDTLRIELIRPADNPPAVQVTWPAASSVTNADPRGPANLATAVVRIMAEAQARLAKIRSKRL
jgi:hypothetical protein